MHSEGLEGRGENTFSAAKGDFFLLLLLLLSILDFFYTPPHESSEVLYYTLRVSVRQWFISAL